MTEPKTSPEGLRHVAVLGKICQQAVARAKTQRYRGQKRDDYVIDYLAGAVAALSAVGEADVADYITHWAVFVIASRGFAEVERIAAQTA